METLLFLLLCVVLPMVLAYRIAPRKGRPQLGFMLLGWLGVLILLCMKDEPRVAPVPVVEAEPVPEPRARDETIGGNRPKPVYTTADYNRAKPSV